MSRSTTLPAPWTALVDYAGGVAALAAALGCGVSTLRSWGAGTRTPGLITRRGVNAWAKQRRLPPPWPVP